MRVIIETPGNQPVKFTPEKLLELGGANATLTIENGVNGGLTKKAKPQKAKNPRRVAAARARWAKARKSA